MVQRAASPRHIASSSECAIAAQVACSVPHSVDRISILIAE